MTIPRLLSQRIGFRLLLSILAASVVATSLTTVVQLYFRYQRDLAEIDTQRQEIERTFLPVLTENLWTADREQARLLLNGLVQLPDLQYAAVRTPKGQIFASASLGSPPPFQKAITFATPIIHRYKGEPLALGSLELIFSLVPLQGRLHNDALIILLTEGGRIFFVSICILLIVHQLVTRHLARISDYLQRFDIEKSDLPLALTRTRREEQDELAAVVESINLLRSRLLDSRQEQEQLFASLRNSRDQLTSKVEELEEARKGKLESEKQHRTILDRAIDGFFVNDTSGRFLDANDAYCRMVGYSLRELQTMFIPDLEAVESREEVARHIEKVIRTGNDRFESAHFHKDGHRVELELSVNFVSSPNNLFFAFARDISRRKKTEAALQESEEKYRLIAESSSDAIFQLDLAGRITLINPAGEQMYGCHASECLDQPFAAILDTADDTEGKPFLDKALAGHPVQTETFAKHHDGHRFPISLSLATFSKEDKPAGFTCIVRDITHRWQEEEARLKKSLEEKESLLKEIHHRVKNNMQIVLSLLFLQAEKSENAEYRAMLRDSQNRIKSMGLIHEMLYKTENLAQIDFHQYLRALTGYLAQSHASSARRVAFVVEAKEIFLPIDIAIPCGLILTELVTNSLKYAFTEKEQGEIAITLHRHGNSISLAYRDNGCGLPPAFAPQTATTLGMNLIRNLADQIDASLEFHGDNGVSVAMVFTDNPD